MQGFGGKHGGKRPLGRPRRRRVESLGGGMWGHGLDRSGS
jgi:hypothetical protein